ncbi:DNA polymerase-1 [Paenibacillus turicensis]|uniref:DNA polymerase I n=1 Tax=Paenibacillus turicensis TaxID=160487 RepID=A0ABS4FW74_9BACL|nr:DNA polymerase I [Paenibacillus turicensis]MBP1906704.1 DNA polymerase-1 [Paenibacillus turicensis]
MSKLILIDGNSIIYRAFFAMPPLNNSSGLHTNAVYGFTNMFLRLIQEEKPSHILVAFDAGKQTFRHETYQEYKGGRDKTPSELSEQFPLLKQLLESFGVSWFELAGYEADDIIGTLSKQGEEEGFEVLVVTGDKDLLQVVSDRVSVALTRKGISEVDKYDPEQLNEKYGLKPLQIIDLKGLMGDASDNIPGIPGVGEKTALKLLHQFGSVEGVLANIEELKGKMKEKIETHADDAVMSKQLATIYREVPVEQKWDNLVYEGVNKSTAVPMLQKLEFKSILERMAPLFKDDGGAHEIENVDMDVEVVIVNEDTIDQLLTSLSQIKMMYVESHGDNPHRADLIGLVLATNEVNYYISRAMLKNEVSKPVLEWLGDEDIPKYGFDLHRANLVLHWEGIKLAGEKHDVQLAAYLLDPTESNYQSPGALAVKYNLPYVASDDDVYGKGAKFKVPDEAVLSQHLARKAVTLLNMVPLQREELEKNEMTALFEEMEMPLSIILANMEKQGIAVNQQDLQTLGQEFEAQIKHVIFKIYEIAGMEFNLNSPKQLGEVLFDKLGLPVIKKTKTGYSTDAEVLEKLAPYHEIMKYILDYRQLAKLQSTYVEGLMKEISPITGKVHTYYRQTIAATGRLSSQFPNLQNIPIRMEEGRKIRKVFVPSKKEWSIVAADYSQIELRVLAHISGDAGLQEAFLHDMDIHTKTAMDVFGVTAEQVDSNMRRSAKAVNFGIVYGISDYGLSQNLNITRKEAARFIDQYFDAFEGVRKYMDDIVREAKQNGYVKTLLERRRYLPDINASNFNLRSFAERTAMNTPIQGTAADIIKLAMVLMDKELKERKLQSVMLLQVHDELVFEVPPEELELMKSLVPETMEKAIELSVPLKAEVSSGSNWYEAK